VSRAPRSLAGKVIAITGGARGIGRATAAALIAQGARLAIGDIDATLVEQTAQELGNGTVGLPLDVTDRASFERFLNDVEQRLGPLDVLVNNAGIMGVGPFLQETDAMAERMVAINLHGVIYGSKLALERFSKRGTGHLVNIASSAGKAGVPGGVTYCATKHAVVGLSEAIRGEVMKEGIEVTVVMPVGVNTELYSGLPAPRGFKTAEPEDVASAIVEALQTGRFEVYVPKSLGPTIRLKSLLPTKAADAIARLVRSDRVLLSADHTARAAYEQRMSQTEAGSRVEVMVEVPAPEPEPTVEVPAPGHEPTVGVPTAEREPETV
jgi:NAD(P)-dependent dehydrogenase (short-subunit alcohol dehydrogenase family)